MKVWFRGAALAGGALLLAGIHVGAQVREARAHGQAAPARRYPAERPNHPVVLLNNHDAAFVGGERVLTQFTLQQLDPTAVMDKVNPPSGVDGIIAYPGSRMLEVHGTKEAVASYRASLQKLDRAGGSAEPSTALPVVTVAASAKLRLQADRVESEGDTVRVTGHVVIGLENGIALRAQQVRITTEGSQKRIEIEK